METNPSANTSISVREGILPSAMKRNSASWYSTGGSGGSSAGADGAGGAGGAGGACCAAAAGVVVVVSPSCSAPCTRADDARSPYAAGEDMGLAWCLYNIYGQTEREQRAILSRSQYTSYVRNLLGEPAPQVELRPF